MTVKGECVELGIQFYFLEANSILEKDNASIYETMTKQKELIEKLEGDLLQVNSWQRPEAIVRIFSDFFL